MFETLTIDVTNVKKILKCCPYYDDIINSDIMYNDDLSIDLIEWYKDIIFSCNGDNEEDIKKFHLPRWDEIPNIDLYIDQVVSLLETYLSNYIKGENNKEDKIVTKTMINNYAKNHLLPPPEKKKYSRVFSR